MKKICLSIVMIFTVIPVCFSRAAPSKSADEILDKIDQNMIFKTAYSEIEMIITTKNRTINKTMVSYARGNEKAYIEFLSPPRDKGSKILKSEDIIKVYYPSAERVMRISGHMLRRGMMGSDFSYEDMTERSKKLKEEYSAEIKGEEEINGKACYLLILTSNLEKQTYFTRKAWIDKERFVVLKEELYAKSGKLLKVLSVQEIKTYQGRYYPIKITLEDKLKKNSSTQMVIKKIDFDISIPEETFSERQLMKK